MNRNTSIAVCRVIVASAMYATFALAGGAQVQTETSTTHGPATHEVTVERGTVELVQGNDLFVKMADGSTRHFANVPESARVTVGGQQLGIHDLKPGMKLERTITTTTTPKVVTTTQSVTGTVWHVSPPAQVILTLDDGKNETFKIPKGQKFNIDGQMLDSFHLKKGMKVTATKVVETPIEVVTQKQKITGQLPPAPAALPPDQPVLLVVYYAQPQQQVAQAQPEAAPQQLPKTASPFPLLGLLGILCAGASLGMRAVRQSLG
jgi:hypothetical protein